MGAWKNSLPSSTIATYATSINHALIITMLYLAWKQDNEYCFTPSPEDPYMPLLVEAISIIVRRLAIDERAKSKFKIILLKY